MTFKAEDIRDDFPALDQLIYGHYLVYLDNAATTMKTKSVIDAIHRHYSKETANIHRGVHYLSEQGTIHFEQTRQAVSEFIHSKHDHEIIFTRGTTESINLVAMTYGKSFLKKDDEIIISEMEHHSNIVPWQILCEQTGSKLKVIPINDDGEIILDEYKKLLNSQTKLVAIAHISNTLGTINPVKEMIALAHEQGAKFLLDAAQSVGHMPVDVQDLDCDFLAFSAHKVFGPTGLGVLYGKEKLLNSMPPYHGGGNMIDQVTFEKTTYNVLPHKFEAGTPQIAEVIAFKEAINYIKEIGFENIQKQEHDLLLYATKELLKIKGLRIIGNAKNKSAVISFVIDGAHPQDIGTLLDHQGIAVRTGHHCTQPLMKHFQIPATTRASFCFYNTYHDIDLLIEGIKKVKELL